MTEFLFSKFKKAFSIFLGGLENIQDERIAEEGFRELKSMAKQYDCDLKLIVNEYCMKIGLFYPYIAESLQNEYESFLQLEELQNDK